LEGGEAMNVHGYLDRIGLGAEEFAPDAESLRRLQRSHLLTVPFENLDIHWKRPIVIDIDRFYAKIVDDRRGGFCYELNGLFNELLTSLSFQTRLISARVFDGTTHGPEFDHAAVIATIGGEEYLADVGFGALTAEPLRFVLDVEQTDQTGTFVIRRFADEYFEVAKRVESEWNSEYIFKNIARELREFAEMCDFQQFSPESHFTKGKLCSIMTENGRKTLTDSKLIVSVHGEKAEHDVADGTEFDRLLNDEFGIERIQ
jgi:N-hydroxyarylamine O-acetyltransferase